MSVSTLLSTDDLIELEGYAAEQGVELSLSSAAVGSDLIIWLGGIERTTGAPGAGRRVLERLFELADETGIDIRAAVTRWNTTLLDYYADLGFKIIHQPSSEKDEIFATILRTAA